MTEARVPIGSALSAFGVDVTVTRPWPDEDPIETRGFWVEPISDDYPAGQALQRHSARRVLVLPKAGLPTLPRGSVVTAPDIDGAEAQAWRVDGFERVETDHQRVIVVPEPEYA